MTTNSQDERAMTVAAAIIGHNRALSLWGDIGALEDRLNDLSDVTPENAPFMRDVMKDAHDMAAKLEDERKAEQKPHEEKVEEVRKAYRPLVDRSLEIKQKARHALNLFLERERLRLEQEAAAKAAIAEQEARAAEAAREELENDSGFTANPIVAENLAKDAAEAAIDARFAMGQAKEGPKVASASGQARAAGQRVTYSAKMVDGVKLAKHFAKDPGVQEAALKAANAMMRATKGTAVIPGAEVVITRNAV